MDRVIVSRQESLLSTHKVLRNTYFLLGLTLACSTITAFITAEFHLRTPGIFLTLVGFYGLLFLIHLFSNSALGIIFTFMFTGFIGYTLGPIINALVYAGMGDLIILSLGITALTFFCCSAYVLTTKKDMSFLNSIVMSGILILFVGSIANIFLNIPLLGLVISSIFILCSIGGMLIETSNIIHNGETNYIRATVNLYLTLYNMFVSLLNLLLMDNT